MQISSVIKMLMGMVLGVSAYALFSSTGKDQPSTRESDLAQRRTWVAPEEHTRPMNNDEIGHLIEPKPSPPPGSKEAGIGAVPSAEIENTRLLTVLRSSGPAIKDGLDHAGYEISTSMIAGLKTLGFSDALDSFECHAAGCITTIKIFNHLTEADAQRLISFIQGYAADSPVSKWKGPRIFPPLLSNGDTCRLSFILLRPDAPGGLAF